MDINCINQKHNNDINCPEENENEEIKVGGGICKCGDGAPDVELIPINSMQAILDSMTRMYQVKPNANNEAVLLEVMQTLQELVAGNVRSQIEIDQEKQRTVMDEKISKLEKASEALAKALRREDQGGWNTIKLTFNLIGAFLSIGVGTALAMTPGLQVAGGLMIASGAVQLVMAIDAIVAETTGFGIAGNFALMMGASKKEAREADFGFRIGLVVAMAALTIASFVMAPSNPQGLVEAVQCTAVFFQGTMALGNAFGEGYTGTRAFVAAGYRQDEGRRRSEALELEAVVKVLQDVIDASITYLKEFTEAASEMLSAVMDANIDKMRSTGRVKFTV